MAEVIIREAVGELRKLFDKFKNFSGVRMCFDAGLTRKFVIGLFFEMVDFFGTI